MAPLETGGVFNGKSRRGTERTVSFLEEWLIIEAKKRILGKKTCMDKKERKSIKCARCA